MNDAVSLHFEVLSGLYCGLTGKAALETSLIGSGLDADIIFVEQRLEPHHLRITLLGNSIEVEALAAGLSVEGNRNIAAGECVVVPLPVVIHAGAMSILWSAQDAASAGSIGIPRLSISVLALVLLSSLGIGALSAIFSYYGNTGALSANSPGAELESQLTNNRADDQTTVAAAKDLQDEVNKAGLLNIKIGSAKGVVTAEGTVTSASATSWQKAQQWFDHRTKGALTLVNGVVLKEEKGPSAIAVEAVWRGSLPYVVIDGEKYFVGALLDDGWTVDRIEDGRVLLSRNGRLAALPY
ncbi:SctD/MshK family protein [Mesorhizobium shangrilense]|uniref:YscD/Y4YQ C-terminal domain-containing protein n=1 Tax=Mesorhizobium shangrilense TaxID=460060 RepID=A0ABV2DR73_9HYPH